MGMLQLFDIVGTFVSAKVGLLEFFVFGLNLEFAKSLFGPFVTLFGLLSPTTVPEYNVTGLAGGCFAGAVGAVNLRALLMGLGNETEGAKVARQDMNFVGFSTRFIGFALAYFSDDWEFVSGNFGPVWIAFFAVMTFGYFTIVSSQWDQLRGPMSKHLFKSEYGDKVDLLDGFLFVLYGTAMFLTATLHLGFMQGFMPLLMSCFGMLSPVPESFGFTCETFAAGVYGMSMAALHLFAFCGVNEDKDIGKVRRFSSIVFWCNSVVAWNKYPENGSFYTFWVTFSLIMAIYQIYNIKLDEGKRTKTD